MPINDNPVHSSWREHARVEDGKDAENERLEEENDRLRQRIQELMKEKNGS